MMHKELFVNYKRELIMQSQSDEEFIPGWWISTAEGLATGILGYSSIYLEKTIGNLLGRKITNLTLFGTAVFTGSGTVLHTLLMEDFNGLRTFIKKHLPQPLNNHVVNFGIDAAASTAILTSLTASLYGFWYLLGTPMSAEDAVQLACLTQLSNLTVNHGLPGLYNLFTQTLKSNLGIKDH